MIDTGGFIFIYIIDIIGISQVVKLTVPDGHPSPPHTNGTSAGVVSKDSSVKKMTCSAGRITTVHMPARINLTGIGDGSSDK
ncbi:hypothetical protein SDC9_195124 [bioreactor metagenome]|uniref:Uncharacterized protein n=1 Tax=bioreactor metagenome TaxID=1076179 RepID=A0A645I869_9ZZZZ